MFIVETFFSSLIYSLLSTITPFTRSSREAIRLLLIKVKPSVAENWKYLRQQLIRQAQNKRPPIHTAPRADFVKVQMAPHFAY